ncbi:MULTISPECIES: GNAT family N-acetyltransferase [Bacillus]|uniref:Acetyltransferase n=2 Tax=Bacillus TaxID=1386 RepID=A0A0M5JL62_9BACI|nr:MULTISPECIES: GNAT family N-acetyltransferase [Bacillus]ALC80777.1 acetyltransferase [Bacillus gobiensis]MBP1079681.1 putative GNAT family N-acyltransferase [Bacillus capparidis]MED1095083.1 GNAT family N-acetyltransferase [Bacillus capparidis]
MIATIAETDQQRKDALSIRNEVFINEQKVSPEIEMDELDETSVHVVLYDGEKPVAAGRTRLFEGMGKLERICVLKSYRSKGCGKQIVNALEEAAAKLGASSFLLYSQVQAAVFYEAQGYKTVSGEFLAAGIPHVKMIKEKL